MAYINLRIKVDLHKGQGHLKLTLCEYGQIIFVIVMHTNMNLGCNILHLTVRITVTGILLVSSIFLILGHVGAKLQFADISTFQAIKYARTVRPATTCTLA